MSERDEIARWLCVTYGGVIDEELHAADAVLALPSLQRLIAAEEAVRRVEAIIARLHPDNHMWRDDLRRALDGDQ